MNLLEAVVSPYMKCRRAAWQYRDARFPQEFRRNPLCLLREFLIPNSGERSPGPVHGHAPPIPLSLASRLQENPDTIGKTAKVDGAGNKLETGPLGWPMNRSRPLIRWQTA